MDVKIAKELVKKAKKVWNNKWTDALVSETGQFLGTTCKFFYASLFVVRCAIWYRWYSLKNMKNTHERVLLLVKLQAKWYQIVQLIIIC